METYLVELRHIKNLRLDPFTSMLLDKCIEFILSAPGDDHTCAILHEPRSQGLSDAGGGADYEHLLVVEGHFGKYS